MSVKSGPIGVVLLLGLITGCTPSVRDLRQMRRDTHSPSRAQGAQETILKRLGAVQSRISVPQVRLEPVWRIEAMRTLSALDSRYEMATSRPDLHRALEDFLRSEYAEPRPTSHRADVQAWSVHALSRMDSPPPAGFFLSVLAENHPPRDPQYRICLGALDALSEHVELLRQDPVARRLVLHKVSSVLADFQAGKISQDRKDSLEKAAIFFVRKLADYPAVVDLLSDPTPPAWSNESARLVVLEWNFQRLSAAEGPELQGAVFKRNVELLLSPAGGEPGPVRRRSRLILSRFAVLPLFEQLAQRVSSPEKSLEQEDVTQLANLLTRADARAADLSLAQRGRYRSVRDGAIVSVLERLDQLELSTREILYARLLQADPALLAEGLHKGHRSALTGEKGRAMQHVRYLLRLARPDAEPLLQGRQERITQMAAEMIRHRALEVRQQVAAGIADRAPQVLAETSTRALEAIESDSHASARFLVETYLACIKQLQAQPGGLGAPAVTNRLGARPLEALGWALRRDERDLQSLVSGMLLPLDRSLLVELVAGEILRRRQARREVDTFRVSALGDAMESGLGGLDQASAKVGTSALLAAVGQKDAPVSLLAGRYMIEMGLIDQLEPYLSDQRALSEMVALARRRAKSGRGPKP